MSILKDLWYSTFGKKNGRSKQKQEKQQEEKIGNVALNAGDHGTIFGFNRNIIVGTGIAIFAITAIATISAMDVDEPDSSKRFSDRKQEASTAQDSRRAAKGADSYEELAKSNAQFMGQGNNQAGRGSGTPATQRQQQNPATSQTPPATLPTVPQVAQSPVTVPAPIEISEEDKEEREYLKRMQSNIVFSLSGGAVAQQGNKEQAAAVPSDNAGVNPQFQTVAQTPSNTIAPSTVSYVAPGKYTLQAGTIIPVVLCTGINSDIGGQVVAQVQQNMYDSATGRNLLIPAGSKILGTYKNGSPNNSGRVEVSFSTIILPDGGSYSVEGALVAIDGAGYSGISGKVDRHTSSMLSAGFFSSALAALGSYAAGNVNNSSNTYSPAQLAAQGATANVMNAAAQLFQQGSNLQMTVTAKPGTMFSIYVTQGITLQRGGAR